MLEGGTTLPIIGKVVVDRGSFSHLIDQMRVAVPEDIKQAKLIIEQRDRIIEDANKEMQRRKDALEEAFSEKLSESHIVKTAEARAKEINTEAERRAGAMLSEAERQVLAKKESADRYTLEVLKKLDAQLSAFLTSIRRGIEALEKERQEEV